MSLTMAFGRRERKPGSGFRAKKRQPGKGLPDGWGTGTYWLKKSRTLSIQLLARGLCTPVLSLLISSSSRSSSF